MIVLDGEILRITPQEELSIYQVEAFVSTTIPSMSKAKFLHVNLVNVEKIDTAGFQVLVALKKSCEALHIEFSIDGAQSSVKNFFELFGDDLGLKSEEMS